MSCGGGKMCATGVDSEQILVTQCDQLCCPDTRGCLSAVQGAGDCQSTTLPNGKASVMCFCDSDKSVLLFSFDEEND